MPLCDRTVTQNFSEIVRNLGFGTQKCTIYDSFTFFGSFFKKKLFGFAFLVRNFRTEILVRQKIALYAAETVLGGHWKFFCYFISIQWSNKGSANSSSFRVSGRCDSATVRSGNIFQRLRKIRVYDCKNEQFTTVLPFWVIFFSFFGF